MQALQSFAHDIRFALRAMRKSLLLSSTIVLCLGFSIGATSTVFAWMESLILTPIPGVPRLGRLVSLKTTDANGNDEDGVSFPDYKEIRDAEVRGGGQTFSGLAAFTITRLNLRTDAAAG